MKMITDSKIENIINTHCPACALRQIHIAVAQQANSQIKDTVLENYERFWVNFCELISTDNPITAEFKDVLLTLTTYRAFGYEDFSTKFHAFKKNPDTPLACIKFLESLENEDNPCKGNPLFSNTYNSVVYTPNNIAQLEKNIGKLPLISASNLDTLLRKHFCNAKQFCTMNIKYSIPA